jgi:hypothetical protein
MEVVVRIDVKQLIIAIGYAAFSVSLIGCTDAPADAPADVPAAIEQTSISETVGHNRTSSVPNGTARLSQRPQLWGEPGSRAAAAGALLAEKIFHH